MPRLMRHSRAQASDFCYFLRRTQKGKKKFEAMLNIKSTCATLDRQRFRQQEAKHQHNSCQFRCAKRAKHDTQSAV
eukprot:2499612-Rhodomonas_salina.1